MKKIFIILVLLTGFLYSQTEVFIVRNKLDTLRIDVDDLKGGLGTTLLPPSDLVAIGDTNRFYLSWTDNSLNEEGFYLSVSSDGTNWETDWIVSANTTTYTYYVTGNAISRYFRVGAYLGGLQTPKITSDLATTLDLRDLTPPYTPYNLTATGGNQQISLAWSDSSTDAVKYYIYRSANVVPADIIPFDSTTAKSYVNSGLGNSEIWHYRIKGRDAAYNYTEYSLNAFDTTDAQYIQDTTGVTNPVIFSALFEGNNLSEFTSSSGTQFSATTASKYSGAYGGEMYFDGITNSSYGIETYAYPDTTYISFRLKISSGITSTATFKYFTVAEFRTAASYGLRFYIKTDGSNAPYAWGCYYSDSTGTNSYVSSTGFTTNAWHLIEIKYKKNATIGGAEVWIDSTKNTTLSQANRNTSANTITNIRFGSTYTSGTFSGGSLYFDNIFADTTRLGSAQTITDTIPVPDTTPPNAPTGFIAKGYYVSKSPPEIYTTLTWVDASSDEAKFYIYKGAKDVIGGNLVRIDSVNANTTTWTDNTLTMATDTLHFYEYGISARDAAYNYTPITSTQKDTAYIPGKPSSTPISGTPEGNAFFVSLNGDGTTGRSWINAWSNLSDSSATNPNGINWNAMSAGDTLYVDGGVSGITYTSGFTPGKSGTYTNYVVITKGTSTGHNGTVTFNGTNVFISLNNASCTEINGFRFTGGGDSNHGYILYNYGGASTANPRYHLRIKNCYFYVNNRVGIYMQYHPRFVEIIADTFYQPAITSSQGDCFFIRGEPTPGYVQDSLVLKNNVFISLSRNVTAHTDGFQGTYNEDIWAEGNKFYISTDKGPYAQSFYPEGATGKIFVFNNIFYCASPALYTPIFAIPRISETWTLDSTIIVNNTFVSLMNTGSNPYIEKVAGGLFMKNNIYVSGSAATGIGLLTVTGGITSDYNMFYHPFNNNIVNRGASYTFASWQAAGRDLNGIDGTQPAFNNFDYNYSMIESTFLNYNFNITSPPAGTAFQSGNFGGYFYTSDGKIGALIP